MSDKPELVESVQHYTQSLIQAIHSSHRHMLHALRLLLVLFLGTSASLSTVAAPAFFSPTSLSLRLRSPQLRTSRCFLPSAPASFVWPSLAPSPIAPTSFSSPVPSSSSPFSLFQP